MQSPASDSERFADRYVVRLAAALAALLGRAEGAELSEDELLGWLRAKGLITYPSPLLVGLLEGLPEIIAAEVLPRLDPTDRAFVAQVGRGCRVGRGGYCSPLTRVPFHPRNVAREFKVRWMTWRAICQALLKGGGGGVRPPVRGDEGGHAGAERRRPRPARSGGSGDRSAIRP
jgi:hypothetical protein